MLKTLTVICTSLEPVSQTWHGMYVILEKEYQSEFCK
jgi:hypothetical protein